MSDSAPSAQPPQSDTPLGQCIVVFGTKGGVGKTVVATNLGVCLAQRFGKRVCLVDLDVTASGDAAKIVGLNPEHTVAELALRLRSSGPMAELSVQGLVTRHASGLHVIQCAATLKQGRQLDAKALHGLFQALKSTYDYIVVDSKGLTDPLIAAFDEANLILLISTPDIISLYQTKWAVGIVESLLFPPQLVKGLLNRAESRGGVGSHDARLAMPCELIGEIPSDGRSVGTAVNRGAPVVTLFPSSRVAEAFRRLAQALVDRPDLFLAHQELTRQRRQQEGGGGVASGFDTGLSRLFAVQEGALREDKEDDIARLKRRIHDRLVQELDLKKVDLDILSNQAHMQEMRGRCERVIAKLLSKELGGIISSHEVRTQLVKEITDEALGLGPLEELIADPSVTDILVNNKDQIYVERHGRLEASAKKFLSNDQIRAVIERIVAPLGRRIDESSPMVDARLPDGSRVNAIIPPLSVKGPVLSIRKFARVRYTADDLIQFGSLNPAMCQFIQACVQARKNIVISGGTGSGKTTFLNIVSNYIPPQDRIISIEDAAELRLTQAHWVSLEARPPNVEGKGQVTIRDLFRNALRMRPDRIIIGECRGPETLDMLQAMNTGHDGSLTTVHANSPKDVISRVDSMVLMSNIDLPVLAIREMVASAVHLIVHVARLSDGSRKIVAISELTGLRTMEILFQDLFVFQQTGIAPDGTVLGDFVATGNRPTFLEELRLRGVTLDDAIFQAPSESALSGS